MYAWEEPTVFIIVSGMLARAAPPGYRIASTFAVARSARARARARDTIDTGRKKSSRAKVYIRARSKEMREERARYLAAGRRGKRGKRTWLSLTKSANALALRFAEKSRLPSRMHGGMYTRNARDMFPVKLSISANRAARQQLLGRALVDFFLYFQLSWILESFWYKYSRPQCIHSRKTNGCRRR